MSTNSKEQRRREEYVRFRSPKKGSKRGEEAVLPAKKAPKKEAFDFSLWDKALIYTKDGQRRCVCAIRFGDKGTVYGLFEQNGVGVNEDGRLRVVYKARNCGGCGEAEDPRLLNVLREIGRLNKDVIRKKTFGDVVEQLGLDVQNAFTFDCTQDCDCYPDAGFEISSFVLKRRTLTQSDEGRFPINTGKDALNIAESYQQLLPGLTIKPVDFHILIPE